MRKGLTKRLLSIACTIVITITSTGLTVPVFADNAFSSFADNYESTAVGVLPDGYFASYDDGKIAVADFMGNKVLEIAKNADGQMSTVTRKFGRITDGGLKVSFDFRQKSIKSDGTTVIALANSDNAFIQIETKDGNISFKNSSGSYEPIVTNYLANKWYSFEVDTDLANGTVSVSVGGKTVLRNVAFTSSENTCNSVYFATKFSPGFMIDNLNVKTTNEIDLVKIDGTDKVTVPISGENKYEYTATIFDDYGNVDSEAEIEWEITPANIDGVTFEKHDKLKDGMLIQYLLNTEKRSFAKYKNDPEEVIVFNSICDFTNLPEEFITWNYTSLTDVNASIKVYKGVVNYVDKDTFYVEINGETYVAAIHGGTNVVKYGGEGTLVKADIEDVTVGTEVLVRQRYNNTRDVFILE